MFGGEADRLAQAQPVGVQHAGIGRRALGLVGGQNHMRRALAQDLGKDLVGRGDAGARINHEQADIGHVDRPLGQPPHPPRQAVIVGIFQPGGIYDAK